MLALQGKRGYHLNMSGLQHWLKGERGRTAALAKACGVTHAAVRQWSVGRVPAERVLQIESHTGLSRHVLRPDVFGGDQLPGSFGMRIQEAA